MTFLQWCQLIASLSGFAASAVVYLLMRADEKAWRARR